MQTQLLYALKRPFHFIKTGLLQGLPAQIRSNFPEKKLRIIAITGTDGKTTTSTLLQHVLLKSGKKSALISTIGFFIGKKLNDSGLHVTAPQPKNLYHFMKTLVHKHYEFLILEATSHGIYQFRTWGIKPEIAAITNISQEHLDYHGSYETYVKAKFLLLKKGEKIIINADDRSYHLLSTLITNKKKLNTFSQNETLPSAVHRAINKRFPEQYNVQNARLVFKICLLLGISEQEFALALPSFQHAPGRMQWLKLKKPYQVLVDFAHTTQGLKSVLNTLKKQQAKKDNPGKIIVVFGCAGLRDKGKRPAMGKAASELADLAIFTSEDPRTENIWSIIRQMKEQMVHNHDKVVSIPDRKEAIRFALKSAKANDYIAVLGKGHEKSMCYGTTEIPWNDAGVITKLAETSL